MPDEKHIIECLSCLAHVEAFVEGQYISYGDDECMDKAYIFLKCLRCGAPFLAAQEYLGRTESRGFTHDDWGDPKVLYPMLRSDLGFAVPESVREIFQEASGCHRSGFYTACAIMCRKAMEALCFELGASGSTLAKRLKSLYNDEKLDPKLHNWATLLRLTGNNAAHEVSSSTSKEDATDILDFTQALIEYVFVFEEKYKKFIARMRHPSV